MTNSKTCPKCESTGWYHYDENHAKMCEHCCKHDNGWWEISDKFTGYIEGADNRCCNAGCGVMYRDLKNKEGQVDE